MLSIDTLRSDWSDFATMSGGDRRSSTSRCEAQRSGVDAARRARYAEVGTIWC
jgi:hypothetical protein